MTYKENLVVAIKSGGQILREKDSSVTLPFGSEFSILLKNLDSRKATVRISIDGKNIMDGKELVVDGNSSGEIERFIREGGRRFRFIQKTKEIAEYRGDRIDDSLIKVDYRFEKRVNEVITEHHHYHDWDFYYPWGPRYIPWCEPTIYLHWTGGSGCSSDDAPICDSTSQVSYNMSVDNESIPNVKSLSAQLNADEGITVEGSKSYQNFIPSHTKELEEQWHTIVIRLKGYKDTPLPKPYPDLVQIFNKGIRVEKAITVKDKLICPTCGLKSKSNAEYCSRCGTYLG